MIKLTSYGLDTKEIETIKKVESILCELAETGEDFTDDTGRDYSSLYIAQLYRGIEALGKGSVFTIKI